MQPIFLGKITSAANEPSPLTADLTMRVAKILFVTVPGQMGCIYIGGKRMNTETLAEVMLKFNPSGGAGASDWFALKSPSGSNTLGPADYWVASETGGEGVLVTLFIA